MSRPVVSPSLFRLSLAAAPWQTVREQLAHASEAAKCHACGCFRSTADALGEVGPREQAAAVSAVATHLANRVAAWDAAHNPPAHGNVSHGMLRAMRHHTAGANVSSPADGHVIRPVFRLAPHAGSILTDHRPMIPRA